MTVQPGKLSPEDSDAAQVEADVLAVPRVAGLLMAKGLAEDEISRVTGDNAALFHGLRQN